VVQANDLVLHRIETILWTLIDNAVYKNGATALKAELDRPAGGTLPVKAQSCEAGSYCSKAEEMTHSDEDAS